MTEGQAPQPWERQEGEGNAAWEQFQAYRDQDRPRSLERLAEGLTVSYGQIRNVSSEWRWADRVAAWDRELDRAENEVTKEEVRRRRREHVKALDLVIDVGLARMRELQKQAESAAAAEGEGGDGGGGGGEESPAKVSPGVARLMIIEGIKAQQLLLGEATERVEEMGAGQDEELDWDALTEDELWDFRRLLSKMRRD